MNGSSLRIIVLLIAQIALVLVAAHEPGETIDAPIQKEATPTPETPPAPTSSQAPKRLPPRPERSAEDRKRVAAELREIYSRPASEWPKPSVDDGVPWQEIGLLPEVTHPPENPYSLEKAELGKLLFFDPRVSGSGQMACASCHDPDLHWADGRTISFGIDRKPLRRNSPSIMNAGHHKRLFWDGRASSLEDQAEHVLVNEDEMRSKPDELAARIQAVSDYAPKFEAAFGEPQITMETITQAIACFERTIVGGYSPFDLYLKGRRASLSDEALLGMDLFRREGRCMNCHHGPNFSDDELHEVGLSYYGRKYEDLGHYRTSGRAEDVGRFRTPSLRNFAATAPYMHNGLFASPRGVMNMYNAGMPTLRRKPHQQDDPLFPIKSPHLRPLGLNSQDLGDMVTFLIALTEPYRRIRAPELPQ